VKLVHLVGFIRKKFVTMHGHMDVEFYKPSVVTVLFREVKWSEVITIRTNECTQFCAPW